MVIAIIAVLIAILLPALSKAREQGRRAKCLANQRALAAGVILYVGDQSSLILRDNATQWLGPVGNYMNTEKVRMCPETVSAPKAGSNFAGIPGLSSVGNAYAPWMEQASASAKQVLGGYAFNFNLYKSFTGGSIATGDEDANPSDADDTGAGFGPQDPPVFYRLPVTERISNIPVFADGIWMEVLPSPKDPAPSDMENGFFNGTQYQMGRICTKRHGITTNVSFFDGHAENMNLQKLWALDWHPGWITPGPLPRVRQ